MLLKMLRFLVILMISDGFWNISFNVLFCNECLWVVHSMRMCFTVRKCPQEHVGLGSCRRRYLWVKRVCPMSSLLKTTCDLRSFLGQHGTSAKCGHISCNLLGVLDLKLKGNQWWKTGGNYENNNPHWQSPEGSVQAESDTPIPTTNS